MIVKKNIEVDASALDICRRLSEKGFIAYVVGGAIRDFLLGRDVYDYDITTNAHPKDVKKIFSNVIPTGIKHGTVTVLSNNKSFEVTTFRSDGEYSDSRHPDQVSFSDSIEDDLSRRDFTINALAYDPLSGELIDNYSGLDDLDKKIIRTIGEPQLRFKEDALRMMRAVRFSSQLGFVIDQPVVDEIVHLSKNINAVSNERIRDELIKLILSPKPSVGLEYLRKSGLMEQILPELLNCYNVSQNKFHKHDVYYHIINVVDAFTTDDYRLRLAGLFHDIAKPICKKSIDKKDEPVFYNHDIVSGGVARRVLRKLKFSNSDVKYIVHLVRNHMFHYTAEWTDGAIRRFVKSIDESNLQALFKLREADRIGNGSRSPDCSELAEFRVRIKEVMVEDSALKVTDLVVDGTDLMEHFKLKPSRLVGNILKHLLNLVLDDPSLNEREKLLTLAKEFIELTE